MGNIIIGVCGKAGSGKDTVANYLVKNYNFKQLSLARYIKEFAGNVFGFTEEQLWGASSKREQVIPINWVEAKMLLEDAGPEWLGFLKSADKMDDLRAAFDYLHVHFCQCLNARVALQYLGTEFGRDILGEDVWIDALIYEAEQEFLRGKVSGVVVSDVRFMNEAIAIHKHKGKLFKLLRNSDNIGTGIKNHASETEQDSIGLETFDFIVNNIGTKAALFTYIDTYMRCHKGDI